MAGNGEMTIDQLAARTGTTSRNIRAYQERGLLPPPRLEGRTGYYNEGHVARLRHVTQLLERGFTLASIRELFEAWEQGYGLAEVIGLEEALDATWMQETSQVVDAAHLAREFNLSGADLDRAVRLGYVVPEGDRYRVPSPKVLYAGHELTRAGIPTDALLAEGERLQEDLERIAARWVALFLDHVWAPNVESGLSQDELHRIVDALNRMRPLALMTIEPNLARAMEQQVAKVATETLAALPPRRRKQG